MEAAEQMTAPAAELAVHCRGVTKSYGAGDTRVTALRGIDLDVARGELLMLVGPSGCGKTTLISIMAGILDLDGGECSVLGREWKTLRQRERGRFRGESIGFVFQQYNLLPTLSAEENVAVPLLINGAARTTALEKARAGLAAVGLGSRTGSLPSQLSGGQQQRVAIARALVHEPKLVVCDEPTSALDHQTGQTVMQLLRNVAQRPDRALVVVTHDARIFGFADRIAHMDDGHVEQLEEIAKREPDASGEHAPAPEKES